MTSHCNTIQEQLTAECAGGTPRDVVVEEHLRGCEVCADWARRLVLQRRALGELCAVPAPPELEFAVAAACGSQRREERALAGLRRLEHVKAPADLDGRVVAATQAGFQQDRALAGMVDLAVIKAPEVLDCRIDSVLEAMRQDGLLPSPSVPEELAERIDEDLRDLPRSITARLLSKLPRLQAPAGMAGGVSQSAAAQAQSSGSGGGRLLTIVARHKVASTGLAAAAALALWMGIRPSAPASGGWSFEVQNVTTPVALTPEAREFTERLTGGLSALLSETERTSIAPESGEMGTAAGPRNAVGTPSGAGSGTLPKGGINAPGAGPAGGGRQQSTSSGGGTSAGSFASGGQSLPYGTPFINRMVDAPFITSFRGDHREVLRVEEADIVYQLDYREVIASDGQGPLLGQFTVMPTSVISPPMGAQELNMFLLQQANREGFYFRYRDFRIRTQQEFWNTYEVFEAGFSETVAGRVCVVLDIRRKDGTGHYNRVSVDPITSLVMRHETTRQNGEVISRGWYETFELNPDLSTIALTGGASQWIDFDPANSGAFLANELLKPSASPAGFHLERVSYQTGLGPQSETWVQYTYGDGVETVFFLHDDAAPPMLGGTGGGNPTQAIGYGTGDTVRSFSFGPWAMIDGLIGGRQVMALGMVDAQDLMLMVQSAAE